MIKTVNRRERKKIENFDKIVRAAYRVFARKGLTRATLKDISEEADVGKGTIYYHFKTKMDLITYLTQNGFNDLLKYCKKGISGIEDPHEQVKRIITAHFSFFAKRRSLFNLLFFIRGALQQDFKKLDRHKIQVSYDEYIRFIAETLDYGVKKGTFRTFSSIAQAYILEGIITGSILQWVINKRKGSLANKADQILETTFYGIEANGHDIKGKAGQIKPVLNQKERLVEGTKDLKKEKKNEKRNERGSFLASGDASIRNRGRYCASTAATQESH